MAKNTSSSAFRKLDVDQCNEDLYREEEPGELQSPPVGPDESESELEFWYHFDGYFDLSLNLGTILRDVFLISPEVQSH
ncbi:Actin- protein 2/3 complex subunit 5 [Homalodisca vitripennis]|nr:Actin- protein 2/3 complex subunit 5 [Homalodisca vitripennis]